MSPTLVMIHGANGSDTYIKPLADAMSSYARVETPNLMGHGGRPIPEKFSIQAMAEDIVAYMDDKQIEQTYLLGYSFGGYTALYIARHFPERLYGICTIAAKHVFDRRTVERFAFLSDPERIREMDPARVKRLSEAHSPQDWEEITRRTKLLFEELGEKPALSEEDLQALSLPALIISSDHDQIVSWPETLALSQHIQGSRVMMFHGPAHPLNVTPLEAISKAVGTWIAHLEKEKQDGQSD